jgi:DNA-binding NtrC family response regulator
VNKTEINNTCNSRQKEDTANVLIVDNDADVARFILEILARKGIRGHLANNERAALDFLEKGNCDLLFTSENVPKQAPPARDTARTPLAAGKRSRWSGSLSQQGSGFELLAKIRTNSPELPVIMIGQPPFADSQTRENAAGKPAHDEKTKAQNQQDAAAEDTQRNLPHWAARTAVDAIRRGCRDFLIKPPSREKIESLLDTFLPNHTVSTIASAQEDTHYLYRIVGRSAKLAQTIDLAKKIAPTSAPVLISGESGTGKELISYLIHHKSRRARQPYVKVNCAALSDSLLESELFGHEKGAFTGAYAQRKGRFEIAHGGTLLLDEVTETPPRFQAKLLRVLEQQDFERVGGNENVTVNVRIISTTNKDLLQQVQEGRFRQDLYYRLSGVRLVIPPLRERRDDLPDLVRHFVNLYAREVPRRITELDPVMMDIFARYHWPGNVRQLRNVVRTSLILGAGETLSLADVSWLLDRTTSCNNFTECEDDKFQPLSETADTNSPEHTSNQKLRAYSSLGGVPLEQIERRAILDTLNQTAGNRTKAAKVLGISDRTLRDKIRRYRQQDRLQPA